MNGYAKLLVCVGALCFASTQVLAQGSGCIRLKNGTVICAQPDTSCAANQRGEIVCTTPGGGMMNSPNGEQLCGPGSCVRDQRGHVFCSSQPRGGATLDQNGNAVCTGGCVPGAKEACVMPEPESKQ